MCFMAHPFARKIDGPPQLMKIIYGPTLFPPAHPSSDFMTDPL
jgi:hypothetical protein